MAFLELGGINIEMIQETNWLRESGTVVLLSSDSQTSIELALLLLRFDSLQISIDFST